MELVFLTLILGGTLLLAFYIARIFKSEVKEEIIEVGEDEAEKEVKVTPAPVVAANKMKKIKNVDKKSERER